MNNKITVPLLTLLVGGVYFTATRNDIPGRINDLRDAPSDTPALGQVHGGPVAAIPLPVPAQEPVIVKPPLLAPRGTKLEKMVKKVRPGVVQVIVGNSVGSGFFIIPSGIVCTNAHVVGNTPVGGRVLILAADENIYPGTLLAKGRALKRDIAFVQLPPMKDVWKALPLKLSTQLSVGAEVLGMGHPMGLPFTVTRGIISGLDRKNEYITYMQTDAPLNPGNSGGPLLTLDGTVVGMNTMIMNPAGGDGGQVGSAGLGFAIIVEDIDRAWKQYLKLKNLDAPWLGVMLDPRGAVQQIIADSPAKKAGIGLDDIVMAVDGKPSDSMDDFLHQLHSHMPGDTVKITIKRGGAFREIPVVLESEKTVPPQRIATVETDILPV